jgi:hypothetical protein
MRVLDNVSSFIAKKLDVSTSPRMTENEVGAYITYRRRLRHCECAFLHWVSCRKSNSGTTRNGTSGCRATSPICSTRSGEEFPRNFAASWM